MKFISSETVVGKLSLEVIETGYIKGWSRSRILNKVCIQKLNNFSIKSTKVVDTTSVTFLPLKETLYSTDFYYK